MIRQRERIFLQKVQRMERRQWSGNCLSLMNGATGEMATFGGFRVFTLSRNFAAGEFFEHCMITFICWPKPGMMFVGSDSTWTTPMIARGKFTSALG